ncbi:hypothetical protein MtrunA17_Chr1g0171361 [Medicago truncatula]|uniref:Uncharacterized protein n=1 Tax=Medicago truncatula TaxID=3880 RepID=A0A396JRT5_MEDTR|nr:hypothetical protein MtrunA17_Chr1g0171361 [Medicago truncatula]
MFFEEQILTVHDHWSSLYMCKEGSNVGLPLAALYGNLLNCLRCI